MKSRTITVAIALLVLFGSKAATAAMYEPVKKPGKVPRQPWLAYFTQDSLERTIDFYLSEPSSGDSVLPLAVYIHGSGAVSHFTEIGGQITGQNGHSTVNDVMRGRARVLIVEKPGVAYLMSPGDSGIATSQYKQFRHEHTLDRWCEAVHAAIIAARSLPDISTEKLLVIGHSEGGLVAAKLAADYPIVTHVAILAGGGPSQLYDLLTLANDGAFFAHISDSGQERVKFVISNWKAIQQSPENDDAMFFGHPFTRWSTFLSTSPIEQLSRTDASIFIAQGDQDKAVAIETASMLYAQLLSAGKDVDFRLVQDADHNFARRLPSGELVDGWQEIHVAIREWFLRE